MNKSLSYFYVTTASSLLDKHLNFDEEIMKFENTHFEKLKLGLSFFIGYHIFMSLREFPPIRYLIKQINKEAQPIQTWEGLADLTNGEVKTNSKQIKDIYCMFVVFLQ